MPIKTNDRIVGANRGKPEDWFPALKGANRVEDAKQWIRDVYDLTAGPDLPDAAVVVAQAMVETGNFTNKWWTERLNAGSLGVTGDPGQDAASPTFKTVRESARAMVAHDLLYATGNIAAGGLSPKDDPRFSAYRDAYGSSRYPYLSDLSGRYAADRGYADTIARRGNAAVPGLPDQHGGTMDLKQYPVCVSQNTDGTMVTRLIWSPVPIYIRLISRSQTNQRPGYTRHSPPFWVQHETGNNNAGADAEMHYRFLLNGAEGNQLSYHFTTDDHSIFQMIPINEVSWQAADGTGPGNYNGVSNEGCVNSDGEMSLMRRNSEYLAAGVSELLSIPQDNVDRHYDFNFADPDRHYCPYYMMIQGYWPIFRANVAAIRLQIVDGSIGGQTPPPGPEYTKPVVYDWMIPGNPGFGEDHVVKGRDGDTSFFFVPMTYTAIKDTSRLSSAWKGAPPSGPTMAKGTVWGGHYVCRSLRDNLSYATTKNQNRVLCRDLLPKVQITKSGTVSVRATPGDDPVIVRLKGNKV